MIHYVLETFGMHQDWISCLFGLRCLDGSQCAHIRLGVTIISSWLISLCAEVCILIMHNKKNKKSNRDRSGVILWCEHICSSKCTATETWTRGRSSTLVTAIAFGYKAKFGNLNPDNYRLWQVQTPRNSVETELSVCFNLSLIGFSRPKHQDIKCA